MKPTDPRIVDVLNDVLTAELTAINQYFLHAQLCGHWGYERLKKHIRSESIDEMRHAEMLAERILLLEGLPNYQRLGMLSVGENVEEQLANDLALEYAMVERLNKGIELAVGAHDNATRALLEKILTSEYEHIDWLETQQETIRQIGLPNYLAQQMHD